MSFPTPQPALHSWITVPTSVAKQPWFPAVHPTGRAGTIPFLPLGGLCVFHSGLKHPWWGPRIISPSTAQPDGKGDNRGPWRRVGDGWWPKKPSTCFSSLQPSRLDKPNYLTSEAQLWFTLLCGFSEKTREEQRFSRGPFLGYKRSFCTSLSVGDFLSPADIK